MIIDSDNLLKFYMELKTRDTTFTIFPLCITIANGSVVEESGAASRLSTGVNRSNNIEKTSCLSASKNKSSTYIIADDIPNYVDYANKYAEELMEEEVVEKEEAKELMIDIVKSPKIDEIKKGLMFKIRKF